MIKVAKKTLKICSHCNAVGGELTPRSHVSYVHRDEKDCKRAFEFRKDMDLLESVIIDINKEGLRIAD